MAFLLVLLLLNLPGQAEAETRPVHVEGSDGRIRIHLGPQKIVVERSPLRIGIFGSSGRRLLSTIPQSFRSGGVRYGSPGFSVGADLELVPPSLGEQDTAAEPVTSPRRYVSRRVERVRETGHGVELLLSTDDPDGRRMKMNFRRSMTGLLKIDVSIDSPKGVSAVSTGFTSPSGEAFHGFGGRRESTDLRGLDLKSWVLDYRYPDASTGWYSPFPGFISSRGYGFFLSGDRTSRWRMASDSANAWRVSKPGHSMTMTISRGGAARAIGGLTSVTGRHRIPPYWSTGPMLSRTIGILTDRSEGVYQQKVLADVDRIVAGDLPVSSYGFEGWAGLPRDFVREQIGRLRDVSIKSFLYLRSFVSNDVAGTEAPGAFDEAIARGFVATDSKGDPYLFPSPFPGAQAALIDFTDPAAVRWWRGRVFDLLGTGALGFMNDFGEQVEEGMHFSDGSSAKSMHNRYPVLQAKVTRQAVTAWEKKNPGPKVFFFQRAGFAGSPGSAAYEGAQFPGDETVDWQESTGLPSIVPDMLNRAVTGSPGFTIDIGGYAQFTSESPLLPPTSAELFTRWSEAVALTPFFRVHNSGLDGVRMPWDFDAITLKRWTAMADLHNRARPLFKRLWKRFEKTGVPMTLPLWFESPRLADDPHADDEWQVGHNLLVAPVLSEGATTREVTLPGGCWRLHGKGAKLRGVVTVPAPPGVLPWFTVCGTRPLATGAG